MRRTLVFRFATVIVSAFLCAALASCSIIERITNREEHVPVAAPEDPISVRNVSAGTLLDFFSEVAFGSEYGESADIVCKWDQRIKYYIEGDATDEDRSLISRLCERLNEIEGFPGIGEAFSLSGANMTVSFIPRDEIVASFEHADVNCAGMAEYEWDEATGKIIQARCAIDSALEADRANTVCEEFLQSLGPARDSYLFSESAFYQGYTLMPFPSDADFAVMEMLYSPRIPAGTPRLEAISLAAQLLDWGENR